MCKKSWVERKNFNASKGVLVASKDQVCREEKNKHKLYTRINFRNGEVCEHRENKYTRALQVVW